MPKFDPNATYEPVKFDPSASFDVEDANTPHSGYDTLDRIKQAKAAFDKAAQTEPIDTSSFGGFAKSVANNLGAGAVRMFSPIVHPLDTAAGLAQMGKAAFDPMSATDLARQAITPIAKNPSGEAVAAIPQAVMAIAGGGEAPTQAKNLATRAESASQAIKGTVAGHFPSFVDGPPESLVTRAIKPGKNNVNWNADVQQAVPLMKSAEQQLGKPIANLDDALQAAQMAKKDIWQQYQQRLGPAAQRGVAIDGNKIADAMVNSIDKRTAAQNPGLVAQVKAVADTYRRPLALDEAEDFLKSANNDLTTYYAKNKVARQVAQNDPAISSTLAEAEALRSSLYSQLDRLTGPGAAQLKKAYGSLSNMEKELYGRQLVAARQNTESLAEQLSTARGVGKIAKGVLTASPGDIMEGSQNIAVSRFLKERNSSDNMIQRAFEKAQPAQPFPQPSFPKPASYLLPEKSGAPTIIPYYPEMSAGERTAALMQYLRAKQQLALPSKASPIPLPPPQ